MTDTLVYVEIRKLNADNEKRHQEMMKQLKTLNTNFAALVQVLAELAKK